MTQTRGRHIDWDAEYERIAAELRRSLDDSEEAMAKAQEARDEWCDLLVKLRAIRLAKELSKR